MRLFGSRKKEEPSGPTAGGNVKLTDAIMQNREAVATLEKRQALIEKKIADQLEEAKARARAKDKNGGILALKKKKMLENELTTLQNSRMTLEQQILSLESSQTQAIAVSALATGVQAQKNMNTQLNVDKLDELMEDLQEQQDMQNEISNVLATGAPMMDEDELLGELEEMEAAELEKTMLNTSPIPTQEMPEPALPDPTRAKAAGPAPSAGSYAAHPASAPSAPPPAQTPGLSDDEAAQLAALQAELG